MFINYIQYPKYFPALKYNLLGFVCLIFIRILLVFNQIAELYVYLKQSVIWETREVVLGKLRPLVTYTWYYWLSIVQLLLLLSCTLGNK